MQSDSIVTAGTVPACPLTSFADDADAIAPSPENGLAKPSKPTAHRAAAIKRTRFRLRIGKLPDDDMRLVSEQLKRAFGL